MKMLFISNFYPPHDIGGMEQLCQEVVERMRFRGHACHVLTSRYGVGVQPQPEEGVTRALYLEADVNYYRPLDFFLRRPWQEWANRRALRAAIDTFRPDIVFVWGMWNLSSRVACWAEQWLPGRVAYNMGGYGFLDPGAHWAYWENTSKNSVARVLLWPFAQLALGILKLEGYPPRPQLSRVSCCSQYVMDVLTNAGVIQRGAVVILNGIDPAPFVNSACEAREPNASLRLLYFGGLMEHKGVHTAIEALGLLQQRGQADRLQLTIVGGGHPDYEARLHALTRSLALEDKVQFVGRVPRSEIPKILPNHDVFLFTSIYAEPFGRTIVEAMAAGLAVIGTPVGGSKEIFQFYPENMLFEPGDAETLACQIQRVADKRGLLERLGRAGRALVLERFTLERMVDEMETWLAGVVE
jgi:glycogen(starch) synthase